MGIELRVPTIGESVTEVEIGAWLKKPGEPVRKDEPIVSLESEKATVEVPAPESGSIAKILKQKGEMAKVGEVIAELSSNATTAGKETVKAAPQPPASTSKEAYKGEIRVMPAAEKLLSTHGLRPEDVSATGPGGRVLKEDVLRHVEKAKEQPAEISAPAEAVPGGAESADRSTVFIRRTPAHEDSAAPARQEETVPMSRLRRTIAERLVEAQRTAALLTTFNEIDMSASMALRKEYGESFQLKYGVKLGFMSFFVKAAVDALKLFPAINAEVKGTNIVYHNYYDIGVAIGSGKGLVVPVLRNAEHMSFAQVEMTIGDFAKRAKENKLKVEELQGGTFTISNGGVYGSMLSTPIINPPQSGILGMHAIQERPVVREGAVVVRPIMYVALTYDHRIVDGREAVSFLRRIKEIIEAPARMLMEI